MNKCTRRVTLLLLLALFTLVLTAFWGCGGGSGGKLPLVLAATADLQESGILEEWVRDFQSRSGWKVEMSAVVDAELLGMVRHGECDLIIAHVPIEEEKLETSNYVEYRQEVMHDDFIIVGPPGDPAGVRGTEKATDGLGKVAAAKAPFLLRADGSGTALVTGRLLSSSGVVDPGTWLMRTDSNMVDTLRQASQIGAYTVSDRSSYNDLSGELNLEILLEGDKVLYNPYHAMAVSGLVYPDTDLEGARKFIDYLMSDNARRYFDLGAWEPPAG